MSVTDPAPLPAELVGRPPRSREEWDVPAETVAAQARALLAKRQLAGALAEQRHQLLDLDADSACLFPGATCPACPPKTDTPGGAS